MGQDCPTHFMYFCSSCQSCEVEAVIFFTLQIRKLKLREVKELTLVHIANEEHS